MELRSDGRSNLELRSLTVKFNSNNILDNGSSIMNMGDSSAMSVVWKPEEIQNNKKSSVEVIVRQSSGLLSDEERILEYQLSSLFNHIIFDNFDEQLFISIAIQIFHKDGPLFSLLFNNTTIALINLGVSIPFLPISITLAQISKDENDINSFIIDPNHDEFNSCIRCVAFVINTTDYSITSIFPLKGLGITLNNTITLIIQNSSRVIRDEFRNFIQDQIKKTIINSYDNLV